MLIAGWNPNFLNSKELEARNAPFWECAEKLLERIKKEEFKMNAKLLKEIISKGEGTNIEFKESHNKLNRDVFESVCAFLNRNGGHLVLGVKNDRCVVGIDPDSLKKVINKFITSSNNPHGSGLIDPHSFSPYPKNPIIANFFKEIGLADELGSGIKNSFKYCQLYAKNRKPEFEEGDIFKTIIPITPQVSPQVEDSRITNIIKFCKVPKSRNEIQKYIGIKDREYFRKQYLNPLIKKELLKLTIPDKPNSPKQKYYSDI